MNRIADSVAKAPFKSVLVLLFPDGLCIDLVGKPGASLL